MWWDVGPSLEGSGRVESLRRPSRPHSHLGASPVPSPHQRPGFHAWHADGALSHHGMGGRHDGIYALVETSVPIGRPWRSASHATSCAGAIRSID